MPPTAQPGQLSLLWLSPAAITTNQAARGSTIELSGTGFLLACVVASVVDGAGKDVVLVAKKGTELPFNVADVPVIYQESFEEFKQELRKRLQGLSAVRGRF